MIMSVSVKVVNKSTFDLPAKATIGSAGYDIKACFHYNDCSIPHVSSHNCNEIDSGIIINPGGWAQIHTGLHAVVPRGYMLNIYPRSGLAYKHNLTLSNCVGVVDSDYTDEICVLLSNHGDQPVSVTHGMRIAQFVVVKCEDIQWQQTDELTKTDRDGGFGSTGNI